MSDETFPIVCELLEGEARVFMFGGDLRQERNGDIPDAHGFNGNGKTIHRQGAASEGAWAKVRNIYWCPETPDYKSLPGDVGDWQVRSTMLPDGCLILHPEDPDHARYVLGIVSEDYRTVTFVGWIYGWQGKKSEFWREDVRSPAFFVPQSYITMRGWL